MLKSTLSGFMLPLLLLVGSSSDNSAARVNQKSTDIPTETIEKLIAVNGTVTLDFDLNRLNDAGSVTEKSKVETLRFALAPDSFFTIVVSNDALRGPLPGSMGLIPQNAANLPAFLNASLHQLVLEKKQSDEAYELVVRDSKSGFVYFNVEGHQYEYDAGTHSLSINDGVLLISEEFARQLGHPGEAGAVAGKIFVAASMSAIEIQTIVNGAVQSAVLPPLRSRANAGAPNTPDAIPPGPDVIVGDLPSLAQFGSSGTQVGLAVGTTSCNNGTVELNWFQLTNVDHPVIPQNLYRMSGGTGNNDRFEQIGQSWLKHAFTALQNNACGFGCTPAANGTHLGVGCSDPYSASLNAQQQSSPVSASGLGSRAWVNPFTGAYPSTSANHTGHSHGGTTHRILVEGSDLNTTLNPGATYYAEAQYVTPHEYAWCQAHPGECNMYNNASYRQFSVTGTTSFSFSSIGNTVRTTPAINVWTGATINKIEPVPGVDGQAFIAYKVTGPVAGVWHYEYAFNNQNLDRGIQSFSVPLGAGVTVSNLGFHAPLNPPGIANDGTQGSAGFSNVAWTSNQTGSALSWSSETFAQNQNANALRWGTLYNFRFDSNSPPQATNATIGFFKTGSPIAVGIQGPAVPATPTPSPTPTPTATPNPTATPTPTPPPSLVATLTLPTATIDPSSTNFTQPVVTSAINAADNLVGFQGDFTFDETVVTFQSPPVSSAGLTASNWNVSGNILPGAGPMRTLRVSAFSNDFTPLSGSGTLYNLNMTKVSSTPGASTALTWAPDPDNFIFIDANLDIHAPGTTPPGSITILDAVNISGAVSYCSNPVPGPVPNVTLTLSGSGSGSTLSDGSGNYMLSPLTPGGSYTVTPTKAALLPGAAGISTVDVVGVQRHFLNVAPLPAGCRLTAADVDADTFINTVDVIAIQRFFLGRTTGIANAGKYQFSPASRTYPAIGGNQTNQNYDTLVFGDVAGPFAERLGGPSQTVAGDGASVSTLSGLNTSGGEVASTVAEVALPEVTVNPSKSNFIAGVRSSAIDAKNKLVGFQGDFTFDERVVSFQSEPVQKAGITGGNWNVSGNVLPGRGPIRTLRISAYSNDFTPLSGSGTLFELRMTRVSKAAQSTQLIWAAAPDGFVFIDADLKTQKPGSVR